MNEIELAIMPDGGPGLADKARMRWAMEHPDIIDAMMAAPGAMMRLHIEGGPTSPMIERVARGIAEARLLKNPGAEPGQELRALVEKRWRLCIEEAYAALRWMREPTLAMLEAGDRESGDGRIVAPLSLKAWEAAIDEALRERPDSPPPQTHDYTRPQGHGHDFGVSAVLEEGRVLEAYGWGPAVPGDVLLIPSPLDDGQRQGTDKPEPWHVRVEQLRRPGNPPDQWFATLQWLDATTA